LLEKVADEQGKRGRRQSLRFAAVNGFADVVVVLQICLTAITVQLEEEEEFKRSWLLGYSSYCREYVLLLEREVLCLQAELFIG